MGSICSAIADDEDDYRRLCSLYNERSVHGPYSDHADRLREKYKAYNKLKSEIKKLDSIMVDADNLLTKKLIALERELHRSMFKKMLEFCSTVVDDRTIPTIKGHAQTEMVELEEEIYNRSHGISPGPDGIIGEAIDVMLCMVDIIFMEMKYRRLSYKDVKGIVQLKLDKWKRKYSRVQ